MSGDLSTASSTPTDSPSAALSFGGVADAYERGRPVYPLEAAEWLMGTADRPLDVLELGAGTGKLTRQLLALGHTVTATDPDPAMLEVLQRELPEATTYVGTAEDIAAPDRTYDVVVAAQCFHWFDTALALPEIARVLKPGGHLALVRNDRDGRIPWVKKLGSLIGTPSDSFDPSEVLLGSELFDDLESHDVKFRQQLDRHSVQDLALSRSTVAVLDDAARQVRLADVLDLYDDYGRGMDGMQLPYFARCFRARVVEVVVTRPEEDAAFGADGLDPMTDTMPRGLRGAMVRPARATDTPPAGSTSDDMLLIDFR